MPHQIEELARRGAAVLDGGFARYHAAFEAITARAKRLFEERDWRGIQEDDRERLDIYGRFVAETVDSVQQALGARARDKAVWHRMRELYTADFGRREIAETFFNSVSRDVFPTVGADREVEYTASAPLPEPAAINLEALCRIYQPQETLERTFAQLLEDYRFEVPWIDAEADAASIAAEVRPLVARLRRGARLEMLRGVFFRNKGAYIVGRLNDGDEVVPLLLPVLNPPDGVIADAALTSQDEASIVFSFTRSYFHVRVERLRELIVFLSSIMPQKRINELYISIGYHKHGKTELYRDLMQHLDDSSDHFILARGIRGMVMSVFTLPSYNLVFKVIKDAFDYPKSMSRQFVMDKYRFVFTHDRVGRLVDAQEFQHLEFERRRFSKSLLDELLAVASETVRVEGERVIIRHLYTERRLIPLNIYIKEAPPEAARAAVIDYGHCIKDLAATNIFPGDMFLKNLGVTRHGRVVFYDYDELCLLTEVTFRRLPEARTEEEELAAEPWYYVGPNDVFPEELPTFLGLDGHLRDAFMEHHADLFTPDFWWEMQSRQRAGEVLDFFPYRRSRRFPRPPGLVP